MDAEKFSLGADKASSLLKALASPYRLMILCYLQNGECPAGRLAELVGLGQSALSQHLARLRQDGIVATRRDAQTIYYRIRDQRAVKIVKTLYALFCSSPLTSATEEKP